MTDTIPDDLRRDFSKTAAAFEKRFATEADCRADWIKAGWGGQFDLLPKQLERVKGIEPSSSVWKTVALPLSYTRNPGVASAPRAVARSNGQTKVVDGAGFEPA